MGSSLDQLLAKAKEDEKLSFLPIIVKSDVRGSGEAIVQSMEKIKSEEIISKVVSMVEKKAKEIEEKN